VNWQASWQESDIRFHHFRDTDGYESYIVLEREGRELAGVEVKAAVTVTNRDFRGLIRFQMMAGKRFKGGVVLYAGESTVRFSDGLFAVPVSTLLG
jgi:predicted AAA+ superfamily ATPase